MKTLKNISKLFLLALLATTFTACNDKFNNPNDYVPEEDGDKNIITIAELKKSLWDRPNFLNDICVSTAVCEGCEIITAYEQIAHASWIREDVYIKGRVISDDRQGNFYKQLFIQDSTSGIVIKLGLNGLYNFYDVGQTVYVKCQNLVLGFYRGMYEIGYYPDNETYYPTSYIDIPTLIDNHILPGDPKDLQPIKSDTITIAELTRFFTSNGQINLNDLKNDMRMGTLITVKDLQFQSTEPFLGNMYPRFNSATNLCGTRNRRTGVEIKPGLVPSEVITTWALTANDLQKLGGKEVIENRTNKVVFLNHVMLDITEISNTLTEDGKLLFIPRTTTATVSHYYKDGSGTNTNTVIVRTSGFAKFAGLDRENRGDFTGVIGIYTSRTGGFPDYQLTLRDLNDVK
ncbi:MAG: DUF5689 domain-containing protein [Bacteroidales bacterium]|jgi:hypothetical protein|nr:DUF5689 domain-containing protein [Bacteroidales bacterium]